MNIILAYKLNRFIEAFNMLMLILYSIRCMAVFSFRLYFIFTWILNDCINISIYTGFIFLRSFCVEPKLKIIIGKVNKVESQKHSGQLENFNISRAKFSSNFA